MNTENDIAIRTGAKMVLQSPLGVELSEDEAEALANAIKVMSLKNGEFLLEEGHIDDKLYVVVNGKMEVCKQVAAGETITLQVLHAGEMAGELGFVDGLKHSASLRALGECTVFSLGRGQLESFLNTDPALVYSVMRAIIRTVHSILRRMNIQHVEMQNYIARTHGRY